MNIISKAVVGTLTTGALAMASATPASAEDQRRHRDRGGISTEEAIVGAVIIGGLAAVLASSGKKDRYNHRDARYRDRDNRRYYNNSERAVEKCVRTAERRAQRRTGSRANVYEIRSVDRERDGFEVKGRIAVRDNYRGRGYRNDYRSGYSNSGWDEGRFTCDIRRGRVDNINFRGIRSLR